MNRTAIFWAFWLWGLAPLAVFWWVARERDRRKEDWAVVAAFVVGFAATLVQKEMAEAGVASNLGVVLVYPVVQVGLLAYGLMARWPSWRPWITAMSVSVSGVVALFGAVQGLFPMRPELATLGVSCVVVGWLALARKDLGLMSLATFVGFGAILPGVIAYGHAATLEAQWGAWLLWQSIAAAGVALTCVALWLAYTQPIVEGSADPEPPFDGLRSMIREHGGILDA